MNYKHIFNLGVCALLTACSSAGTPELSGLSPQAQAVAIQRHGGTYKVGNPYKIMGRWYYPKEDYSYSEVGIASWYGEDFHAQKTANGEKYDMNTLTAAHRTLPLPSIVRVTNLENGRSLVLRVNDRGPYAKDRIIDISKRGAQLLGYQTKGTAKVRVEIMPEESRALKAALLGEDYQAPQPVVTPVATTVEASAYEAPADEPAPVVAESGIFVQAAAFSQKSLADGFSGRLATIGHNFVAPAFVNGVQFYRVRFGPFETEEDAAQTLFKLKSYGITDARIVHE